MTVRAAIASIVLCLQGANSSAAEPAPRKHHIGFGLGTSLFRERDELASPLAYQGLLFGGSLSYEYRGERQDHWAYLGLGGGTLKAAIAREAYPPGTDRGSGALAYANLRYGYHHVVYRLSEGRLDLSAGAVLDMASHDFKPSGASSIIWLTTYSLDAGVMARYQPASRHTLVKQRYLADARIAANGSITYGHVSDTTGYIHIATMELSDGNSAELISAFDDALAPLVDCAGLIIDIRGNGGGQFRVAEAIANRFADTQRLAEKMRYRNGPRHSDFADPILWYAEPAGKRQFTGPVILLTNRYSVSAAEIFTITMRVFPNVTHMGDTTAGALDGPIDRELPNEWLYKLPLGLTTDHNDICYEGQGITPEIQITNSAGTIESGTDQVLEAAIGRFSI
jgi:hypothetical protein